ncbi:uncharacterized protein LOC112572816 isoform X2 [Pomacea canaliculata]|uniref:uncharacterized protein LOC112572816 isoform X2 n=1 Tax=Pomacea canaliculata TaxID=400727 RepID=UPI000D72B405|nr:uncharacterized protein LOC112572816 isoform X2 [Pomacea canaliculata]
MQVFGNMCRPWPSFDLSSWRDAVSEQGMHAGTQTTNQHSKFGSHMEKRANRKRRRQRRKKKTRFRFKCLAKVISLLLRIWRIHSLAMQTYLRQVQAIDLSLDYREEDSILFDLTKYKADREPRLSAKAMRILKKLPTERTPEEMSHVSGKGANCLVELQVFGRVSSSHSEKNSCTGLD